MGNSQSQKARGKLGPRDGSLYQTASRLLVANRVFLESWMVDIHQEGRGQRSAAQRRHVAHLRWRSCCAPRKPGGWNGEGDKTHRPTWGECTPQAPDHLSWLDLGRTQNTGQTESVPLWSTYKPERLRNGKCTQPRARLRQLPCRATWSLSSVDQESTHAVSRGKPSVAQTLRALPTHASDICLQCSSLATVQLDK